jgi:hypothetical protein
MKNLLFVIGILAFVSLNTCKKENGIAKETILDEHDLNSPVCDSLCTTHAIDDDAIFYLDGVRIYGEAITKIGTSISTNLVSFLKI